MDCRTLWFLQSLYQLEGGHERPGMSFLTPIRHANVQWAALAPRNQNVPVTKFEVRRKDVAGTWTTLKLDSASAHYVGLTGDLPGKLFDVRLTGSTGRTLTLTNVRRNDNKQTFDTNF
jgi:expansin (peptidoglycan-binding protein)